MQLAIGTQITTSVATNEHHTHPVHAEAVTPTRIRGQMMRALRFHFLRILVIASLLSSAGFAMADEIPRYHFQVGQQFVFRGERTERHTGADASSGERHFDWKIDVVAHNPDGSWHIVDLVDMGGTFHQGQINAPYERVLEAGDCDLRIDGSVAGEEDPLINLCRLFPRLPADEKELGHGWEDLSADHSRVTQFQTAAAGDAGQVFSFTGTATGGIVGVFEPGSRQHYQFNRELGCIEDVQLEAGSLDPTFTEQGEIRRAAINQIDAAQVQGIAALGGEYDQALAAYKSAVASGGGDQAITSAQSHLQKTADALVVGTLNDGRQGGVPVADAINTMAPDPPSQKDILNQPAPDWSASDTDGRKHTLKEFRGKILLLDFGSRGCPWCVREIPQLIHLAADFKDQPVAILGMDLDADAADAKFVMNAMRIPYLVLMATDACKGYPVEGTPTVVIVDQTGIMRRRMIGYSATGYDGMKAAIQSLLSEKAKGGS